MKWPWQRDPYLTKDGELRIPYGMKGIIVMPTETDVPIVIEDMISGLPAPAPTNCSDDLSG